MKILITGAKGGIGYLTALTLAEKGHKVYLTCHTNKQVKKVKEKIGNQKNITVLKLDITSEKDRLRVLDLDIDCLFNNAAVALGDRKSTRLNSSHANISYAVFCLKKSTLAWCSDHVEYVC